MPTAEPHFLDDAGHLSMWEHGDEILRGLAATFGPP